MKIKLTCVSAEVQYVGPPQVLTVKLTGGAFTSLQIGVSYPTPEQRHAFVVGESYEIDVPTTPESPENAYETF
jgi:hypothetical protein